jgi:hypothetical protein
LIVAAVLAGAAPRAVAQQKYSPQDPEVQEMMRRGVAYLAENSGSATFGEQILAAMAAYKLNVHIAPPKQVKDHALIASALEWFGRVRADDWNRRADFQTLYAPALTCILLLELDPEGNRDAIEALLAFIEEQQQPVGAWGYRTTPTSGDTSQMQYVCLALWLADHHGYSVDPEMGKRALVWLIDTQTPEGGWFYMNPPVLLATGKSDQEVRPSIVAAGLGSVYILSDFLGLNPQRPPASSGPVHPNEILSFKLPPSVTEYVEGEELQGPGRRARVEFDVAKMQQTMGMGNQWFAQNFVPNPPKWAFYYLYAFERYASMRDLVDGGISEVPDWYDQGVEYLKQTQEDDGGWPAVGGIEDNRFVNTAFAVLFLSRSMQITLGNKIVGDVRGGQGLKETGLLRNRNGQIISGEVEKPVSTLLDLVETTDESAALAEFADEAVSLVLSGGAESQAAQLAQLRQLVNDPHWEIRVAAVRFLSQQRDISNAPALIFALTDPDPEIAAMAHQGLRYISRKVDFAPLLPDASPADRERVKEQWTQWYLMIEPDGQLLEPELGQ